ncbi:hypothetical protein BO443_160183 [Burkholderia orbicola]
MCTECCTSLEVLRMLSGAVRQGDAYLFSRYDAAIPLSRTPRRGIVDAPPSAPRTGEQTCPQPPPPR